MNMDVQLNPTRTDRIISFPDTGYDRYQSVFENAIEGIFQMTPDGRYLGANPALARIYGFGSPTELLAELIDLDGHLYVKPDRCAEFQRLMREEGIVSGFESQVYRLDGSIIWISENAVPIRNEQGRIVLYEGFVVDITERRAAREELRQTRGDLAASLNELRAVQAQAGETERLRMLGSMVTGVAHDFNNSLWMILGYGELLQQLCRSKPVAPEFAEYVEAIVTASIEAVEVVTRLGEFNQPVDSATRTALSLNDVIEKAVSFTRPRWETETRGRGITVEMAPSLGKIERLMGNAAELREMFTHLIVNSVEAMPQGGEIQIDSRMVNEEIQITIADTGIGMTPEVRRRCLEPFFTTKGGRSSGVGLAVVFGVVERHGGTIKIESAPGRGAKFIFTFPPGPSAATVERTAPAQCRRPLRILAVDDHPVQTELIAHALGRDWHIVTTASNGRDAIERFDAEYFDLVITDKAMPEMNGDQLAAAIKAREPSMPVIMLTGLGRSSDEVEDLSEFVDVLVAKPASLNDLRAAIAKVIV
jgi:PAS domain S-box-containing protein